jgi:hypothetical protein
VAGTCGYGEGLLGSINAGKWCFMEGEKIFHSPNACVQRVDVSIQVKPCFICEESLIQNGHIIANEIKKLITILMVLPCTLQP